MLQVLVPLGMLCNTGLKVSGSGGPEEIDRPYVSLLVVDLAAWTALLTHPLYWAIWTYLYPQPHDSALLRFAGAAAAIPLLLRRHWRPVWQRWLPLYWYWFVIFVVPVIFTFLLLSNDFSAVWLVCHMGMGFLLILLLPKLSSYVSAIVIGTFVGTAIYIGSGGDLAVLTFPEWYIAPLGFVLVFCFAFMHQTRVGSARIVARIATERERSRMLRALTGTIAHEVRKPVAQSMQSLALLSQQLDLIQSALRSGNHSESLTLLERAKAVTQTGYSGMVRGDMLIGIILRNIREERIDPSGFEVLSMRSVVQSVMESYAFARGQRERVTLALGEDFSVRGDENLLIYVLFNLLQNALIYDAGRPDLAIAVRLGRDEQGGGWLTVTDNGPGIPEERLTGIFESFMTYAHKQGTGLGLPFCKRVMAAHGGSIDVHSSPGDGAEFRLRFPPLDAVPAPAPRFSPAPTGA